jgi:hypothetical protein
VYAYHWLSCCESMEKLVLHSQSDFALFRCRIRLLADFACPRLTYLRITVRFETKITMSDMQKLSLKRHSYLCAHTNSPISAAQQILHTALLPESHNFLINASLRCGHSATRILTIHSRLVYRLCRRNITKHIRLEF